MTEQFGTRESNLSEQGLERLLAVCKRVAEDSQGFISAWEFVNEDADTLHKEFLTALEDVVEGS